MRLDGRRKPARRAHDRQHVAALYLRARKNRQLCPCAHDVAQVNAPHHLIVGDLGKRAPVDVAVGHDHIQRFGGNVEQRLVVDLTKAERLLVERGDQQLAPSRDRQRVARLHDRRLIGIERLVAAPESLDEEPRIFDQLFELEDLASEQPRASQDLVCANLDGAPGARTGPGLVPAAQLQFVTAALFFEIDAHDPRGELGEEPRRADDTDQVGDGKGDRDLVGQCHPLSLRQRQARDGVARGADGRRFGQRTSHDSRSGPRVVGEKAADQIRDDEPGRRENRRDCRLLQALAPQTAKELRARSESDREQEQDEEALLDLVGHLQTKLSDSHSGQQRSGDGAERKAPQLRLADHVADSEHEEERDLGMRPENAGQGLDHRRDTTPGPQHAACHDRIRLPGSYAKAEGKAACEMSWVLSDSWALERGWTRPGGSFP